MSKKINIVVIIQKIRVESFSSTLFTLVVGKSFWRRICGGWLKKLIDRLDLMKRNE
jgi:hypothetical protein